MAKEKQKIAVSNKAKTVGRKYAVDLHPQKEAIIKEILQGVSFRTIEDHFDTSHQALIRYAQEVLNKDLSVFIEQQRQQSNLSTIEGCVKELEEIASICKRMIAEAERDLEERVNKDVGRKDVHSYLKGYLSELRATVESIGRFLGMVKDVTVINNLNTADCKIIAEITTIINEELINNPDIKDRIIQRLADVR